MEVWMLSRSMRRLTAALLLAAVVGCGDKVGVKPKAAPPVVDAAPQRAPLEKVDAPPPPAEMEIPPAPPNLNRPAAAP
ncbi:MAG: hypothetical protein ACRDD1_19940, partial [Planctomycetia bacterium]